MPGYQGTPSNPDSALNSTMGDAWEMITTSRPWKNVRPSAWYMMINSQ